MEEKTEQQQSFWKTILKQLDSAVTDLFGWIKSKTRSEWVSTLQETATNIYQKLTYNTSMTLLVGFLGGVFAVLFLKAIFFLVLISAAVFALIWLIADEQKAQVESSTSPEESKDTDLFN